MNVELHLGDCLDILPGLAADSVDAVVTDPPYGVEFAKWDTKELEAMFPIWLKEMKRVAKSITFTCGWPRLADWCSIEKPRGYIYWYKPGCMGFGLFGFTNIDPMPVYGNTKVRGMTDVIYAPIIVSEDYHPTQKPLKWATGAIERLSDPGDTILDPFMGSGTTGVACVQTGRNFIGIEIEPKYFEIAEKRIAEAQLQMRMPI